MENYSWHRVSIHGVSRTRSKSRERRMFGESIGWKLDSKLKIRPAEEELRNLKSGAIFSLRVLFRKYFGVVLRILKCNDVF